MTKKTTHDVMLYGKVTLRRREYTKINAMHVCLFRTEPSLARTRMYSRTQLFYGPHKRLIKCSCSGNIKTCFQPVLTNSIYTALTKCAGAAFAAAAVSR